MVQVFGEKCSDCWEISVVREDNSHGRRSHGWFDEGKLLIASDGGPCKDKVVEFVWDRHLETAQALCDMLNGTPEPGKM